VAGDAGGEGGFGGLIVKSVATGRHLERVVVALPVGQFAEAATWFAKLCKIMPWTCRLTLIPEFGRIEISPRGQ
jgi:hypothetical protein